jgi:hypothetical protein
VAGAFFRELSFRAVPFVSKTAEPIRPNWGRCDRPRDASGRPSRPEPSGVAIEWNGRGRTRGTEREAEIAQVALQSLFERNPDILRITIQDAGPAAFADARGQA